MSSGLYSGVSGLALGTGLYRDVSGLWSGASGLIAGFDGGNPYSGASLYLDFLTMTAPTFDSRITFSRGSNATLTDSTGKITYAPANLVLQSQTFDVTWAKLQTTVSADSAVAPDGTSTADSLLETSVNNIHYATQAAASYLGASTTAIMSVYAKALTRNYVTVGVSDISVGDRYAVGVFNLSNGTLATSGASGTGYSVLATNITSLGNGWYRCSVAVAVGTSAPFIRAAVGISKTGVITASSGGMEIYLGDGSGIYLWGAQLEPVTYQTTPSTYQATTSSAYYGPRFDYDPVSLSAKGLLIEETRSNLLLHSGDFNNAAWTKEGGVTIANASGTSPDGTNTAALITETSGTGQRTFYSGNLNVPTVTAGSTYTASFYLKAGTRRYLQFTFGTFANGVAVVVDTTTTPFSIVGTGATGTAVYASSSVTSAGNGFYRVSVTGTIPGTGGYLSIAGTTSTSVSSSPSSDGSKTWYCWGAQLEAGAFATSYIPTVASTVTRSADVATMTGTNFSAWYNQAAGSFVVGADTASVGSTRVLVGFASNRLPIYIHGVGGIAEYDGTNSPQTANKVTNGTAFKGATVYASDGLGTILNGGAVATSAYSLGFSTATSMALGADNASGAYLNGHIRSIAYYPDRLSNTQLQSLTT